MASEEGDERDEELASIVAIFPELVLDPDSPHNASLDVEICPSEPLQVSFKPFATLQALAAHGQYAPLPQLEPLPVHRISYLPSLHIDLSLPKGYPEHAPPHFKLSTLPQWLPSTRIEQLERRGNEIWEEYGRSQTIFAYIDMLQQEAESAFGLSSTVQELDTSLQEGMLKFDKAARRAKFEQGMYECGVCLDPKRGTACYELQRCGHVFCKDCLVDFYSSAITEGDVSNVKCPDPDCGMKGLTAEQRRARKQRTLQPTELLDIPLERGLVQRYADLKVKKTLENDKNVIYCPRQWCQAPARTPRYAKMMASAQNLTDFPESESEAETPTPNENGTGPKGLQDRLTICSKCDFAFCSRCLKSWHGDFVACRPKSRNPDELTDEEKASEDWIRVHTSGCPTCTAPCQKTRGCNHMRCFQCDTHFCYLCQHWLDPSNPYEHFNQKGKQCYMRLWELEEGDENGAAAPGLFGGVRAAEEVNFEAERAAAAGGGEVEPAADIADEPAIRNDRGLQRFLELALADEEDEWDSDELDEEFLVDVAQLDVGR